MTQEVNYTYSAKLVKIIDGDTVDLSIDCGFGIYTKQRLRLYNINTPEIRGTERIQGLEAKEYVIKRFNETQEIIVQTIKNKKGKYGRYLAIIHLDGKNLNDELVTKGYAEKVEY